jgi:hypothetical protein
MQIRKAHLFSSIPDASERIKVALCVSGLVAGLHATAARANAQQASARPPSTETRTVRIMDYRALSAPFTVIFRYTPLVPGASGQAEIDPTRIGLRIHAAFSKLPPASRLGPAYLTYVLWAITPEGRAINLGEVDLTGDAGRLNGKMPPSRFGLLVTAEPYFAVSRPGNAVAFEADLAPGATPALPVSHANCELLTTPVGSESATPGAPAQSDPNLPLVIEEARRAIAVAQRAGAQQLAPDTLATAERLLRLAQDQQAQGAARKDVTDTGSEAVLIAEDARVLAVKRQGRARDSNHNPAPSQ